jgi:NTP pyrophosphatase (non-canonical NTP hydrolase)
MKQIVTGLTESAKMIYLDNAAKGFWDSERNVGEMLMLVVSELGEAIEAHRKNQMMTDNSQDIFTDEWFKENVKDTFEDEIADAIIRLLDMSGGLGIDIGWHINAKLKYNASRPRLHGKTY